MYFPTLNPHLHLHQPAHLSQNKRILPGSHVKTFASSSHSFFLVSSIFKTSVSPTDFTFKLNRLFTAFQSLPWSKLIPCLTWFIGKSSDVALNLCSLISASQPRWPFPGVSWIILLRTCISCGIKIEVLTVAYKAL